MTYRLFILLMLLILLVGVAVLAYGLANPDGLPRLTWGILRASRGVYHG